MLVSDQRELLVMLKTEREEFFFFLANEKLLFSLKKMHTCVSEKFYLRLNPSWSRRLKFIFYIDFLKLAV